MVHTDVFLTHDWGTDGANHNRVSQVNDALKARGYKTWFDKDRMTGDIPEQMANGIDNTKVVIIFITERYRTKINGTIADDNCKYEFKYALQQKTPDGVVCVVMEEGMRCPKAWAGILGMYCGSKLYIDMSGDINDEEYMNQQINLLVHELGNCGAPLPTDANRTLENLEQEPRPIVERVESEVFPVLQEALAELDISDGGGAAPVAVDERTRSTTVSVTEYGTGNTIDLEGEELISIVIDNGSHSIKAGFSGVDADDYPKIVASSVFGVPKEPSEGLDLDSEYVGRRAQNLRESLNLTYPIENGVVQDWDTMEKVWQYVFDKELEKDQQKHPVLLTECAHDKDKKRREKAIEIMFEQFHVPAFYLATDTVLALYGQGQTTGVSIDNGDHTSYVVPIFEGYSVPNIMLPMETTGKDLTQKVHEAMKKQGYSGYHDDDDYVHKAKAAVCEIALDYDQQRNKDNGEKDFELPDGKKFVLGNERFDYGEAFFQPKLFGGTGKGLHELVRDSVTLLNLPDANQQIYANIAVTGGTCMIEGFPERLQKELAALINPEFEFNVIHGPMSGGDNFELRQERKYGAWVGGAVLSTLTTFAEQWVTNQEYEEMGTAIVHRKCFI